MRPCLAGIISVIAAFASAQSAYAQDSAVARRPMITRDSAAAIPVNARPPAGMCRTWLDNVPVAQQPAPTDCASAVRNRPAKGRVVFGDDYVTTKRESAPATLPFVKGFAPPKSSDRKPTVRRDTTRPH
jgi:hypothetical protein